MSDVECPYCGSEQEIDHDGGYGYEESRTHDQDCVVCGEEFHYETSISYNYNVYCRDGGHDMEAFGDKWPDMYQCSKCDFYEKRR